MNNAISLLIRQIYERHLSCEEGAVADYIPELTRANPDWFGICAFTADGYGYEIGDTNEEFTIQSISKAFTYGMILDMHGLGQVEQRIGVEPSGEAFNSISLDPETGRPLNPMINAGAIASTGMVPGKNIGERFEKIRKQFSRFAARELSVDEDVYRSESSTGFRNRAIANLLRNFGMLDDPVDEAVEVYFRQCSILVTCQDLAVMAASLANGGVNPVTGERVLEQRNVEKVLSVMSTCGMYDYSGEWIFTVGLPAKSGVGGGVVGVLPGQLGLAVFSPRLDVKGNSVRGVRVFSELSKWFNLHLFNLPVISDQVIRRIYRLSEVGSHRQRPAEHHAAIREHGEAVCVIELQGDIFFSAMERVVRSMSESPDDVEIFILDLDRVGMFDEATELLLFDVAKRAHEEGKRIFLVDRAGKLDPSKFFDEEEEEPRVHFFENLDVALEECEEAILEAHLDKPLVDGLVPFYEFDMFRTLDSDELSTVEGMLEMESFERGAKIISQGEEPDHIYFLAKGSVSIFHQVEETEAKGRRIHAFGRGVCFGDLAVVDGKQRSANVWADENITCYLLSREDLGKIEKGFPVIYGKLIRNILLLNIERLRRTNREIGALKA